MERQTITIETPIAKRQVVLKEWITGREFESLNEPILKHYKVSTKGNFDDSELSGSLISEMNRQALLVWIQSVDGSTENILDTVLDMRKEDYQFVVDKINELSKKK